MAEDITKDSTLMTPAPVVERLAFDHGVHPRHTASGQFVQRSDIAQAMERISDGRQGRDNLPKPSETSHPNS